MKNWIEKLIIISNIIAMASCTAFFCARNAHADEIALDINIASYHFNREAARRYHLNESNPGIGVGFRDGALRKMLGTYRNCNGVQSNYAMVAWTPVRVGVVEVGAFGGVVTGYEKGLQPAAGLFGAVQVTERISLNITAVPTVEKVKAVGFAAVQIAFKL